MGGDLVSAQFAAGDLAGLERRLYLRMSRTAPSNFRDVDAASPETPEADGLISREDAEAAAKEILATARRGINIASHVESRLLTTIYTAEGAKLPGPILADRELGYEHYVVEVSFDALLPEDQRPASARLAIHMRDDVADPARQLRPIRLFPGHEDFQFFRVDLEGAVGLSADLKVTVPLAAPGVALPFGKITPEARVRAGIIVGPYSFPFRKAEIEVVGESDNDVIWSYNMKSTLQGTNMFKSVLVLKVAAEARKAEMGVAVSLVPYKRKWALFQDLLPALTASTQMPIELSLSAS
jgi:hypothetical protein